jgi:Zn-finger nucleic acid-binding protein
MVCPDCGKELKQNIVGGVTSFKCPGCDSIWLLEKAFRELSEAEDRFIRWLEPDLWRDLEKHELGRGRRACPGCDNKLHEVKYAGSDIVVDICPYCRGVWLHGDELQKIVSYLERLVDESTIADYLRELGHEAADIVKHKQKFSEEMRDLGILMKLLEYRIVSKFPALSRISAKLPPV